MITHRIATAERPTDTNFPRTAPELLIWLKLVGVNVSAAAAALAERGSGVDAGGSSGGGHLLSGPKLCQGPDLLR